MKITTVSLHFFRGLRYFGEAFARRHKNLFSSIPPSFREEIGKILLRGYDREVNCREDSEEEDKEEVLAEKKHWTVLLLVRLLLDARENARNLRPSNRRGASRKAVGGPESTAKKESAKIQVVWGCFKTYQWQSILSGFDERNEIKIGQLNFVLTNRGIMETSKTKRLQAAGAKKKVKLHRETKEQRKYQKLTQRVSRRSKRELASALEKSHTQIEQLRKQLEAAKQTVGTQVNSVKEICEIASEGSTPIGKKNSVGLDTVAHASPSLPSAGSTPIGKKNSVEVSTFAMSSPPLPSAGSANVAKEDGVENPTISSKSDKINVCTASSSSDSSSNSAVLSLRKPSFLQNEELHPKYYKDNWWVRSGIATDTRTCLKPDDWLNDDVISDYLLYLGSGRQTS